MILSLSTSSPVVSRETRLRARRGEEIHLPPSPELISTSPQPQQKTVCTIAAHEGTLAAITFNSSGSKLASASEKVSVFWLHLLPGLAEPLLMCPDSGWTSNSNVKTDGSLDLLRSGFRVRLSGPSLPAVVRQRVCPYQRLTATQKEARHLA